MDPKLVRLIWVAGFAALPPVATWVSVTFFGTSLIPTLLGAVTVTVALGFAVKWMVDSQTGETDRPAGKGRHGHARR